MKANLKKTIGIVILTVLTLAAFSMLLGPSVRADTSEVKILSYSWYVAPANTVLAMYADDLVAVGEIENVGSNVIGTAVISGNAYNSTDGFLAQNEARAFITNGLLPGQKVPFYIDFPPQDSVTQDQSWVPSVTNVTVEATYVTDTNATQYSGLTSTGVSASNVDGMFTVAGTVQNTGSETANNVFVDTTFYNSSGSVVGLNLTSYFSLAPGGSEPFTATPADNTVQLSSEITSYSLLVQYETVTTSATSPPATSSPPPTSPSASTQPTQSPAPISSGMIYAVASAIGVIVVVLAALLLLRKRHKNAQFEPPPPPPPPPPP
ncbi:MAG: FxLYD domain-containing protein [Candidatus Bathyarchaeia archaeon]|jgi:hypothetical protein